MSVEKVEEICIQVSLPGRLGWVIKYKTINLNYN